MNTYAALIMSPYGQWIEDEEGELRMVNEREPLVIHRYRSVTARDFLMLDSARIMPTHGQSVWALWIDATETEDAAPGLDQLVLMAADPDLTFLTEVQDVERDSLPADWFYVEPVILANDKPQKPKLPKVKDQKDKLKTKVAIPNSELNKAKNNKEVAEVLLDWLRATA